MNISTKTTKISSVFLATVLIAGMIASSPSFITNALAFEMGDNYGNDNYGNDNYRDDNYRNHVAKDVSFKKIDCSNKNWNSNGVELNQLPETLTGLATAQAQSGDNARDGFNNGERNIGGHIDKDKNPLCISINKNTNAGVGNPPPPPPVEECDPEALEECFENSLAPQYFTVLQGLLSPTGTGISVTIGTQPAVVINSFQELCDELEGVDLATLISVINQILDAVLPQGVELAAADLLRLQVCLALALDIDIDLDLLSQVGITPTP